MTVCSSQSDALWIGRAEAPAGGAIGLMSCTNKQAPHIACARGLTGHNAHVDYVRDRRWLL